MRITVTAIVLGLLLIAGMFVIAKVEGATSDYQKLHSRVNADQTLADGKYKQTLPKKSPEGLDYAVHEYVSPDGPGWQLLIYENNRVVKSYGYGPEAVARTYEAPPAFVVTTST